MTRDMSSKFILLKQAYLLWKSMLTKLDLKIVSLSVNKILIVQL